MCRDQILEQTFQQDGTPLKKRKQRLITVLSVTYPRQGIQDLVPVQEAGESMPPVLLLE